MNAVGRYAIPVATFLPYSERHALHNQQEEHIVDPFEAERQHIKPKGMKLPSKNHTSGEGYDSPSSLL